MKSSWPAGGAAGTALLLCLGLQCSMWAPAGGSKGVEHEDEQQQRQAADVPYELCMLFALPLSQLTVPLNNVNQGNLSSSDADPK